MLKFCHALTLILCFSLSAGAAAATDDASSEPAPYWDYGVGLGMVRFEHYPASEQSRLLALPFPTFQYRGKILRADDRDGAHLYLYKGDAFTLEVSGYGTPALKSSDNTARLGMPDLPWIAAIGPKLVTRPSEDIELSLSAYQAFATDFTFTQNQGGIFEARAIYGWTTPLKAFSFIKENGYSDGKLTFSVRGGSRDYLALYFEVPPGQATATRPSYDAREGLLNRSISYFQSFKSGRASVYVGGGIHSYDISANRKSPLHTSDNNYTLLLGFNYTLGESSRPAVPEEETTGVVEAFHRNRHLLKDF